LTTFLKFRMRHEPVKNSVEIRRLLASDLRAYEPRASFSVCAASPLSSWVSDGSGERCQLSCPTLRVRLSRFQLLRGLGVDLSPAARHCDDLTSTKLGSWDAVEGLMHSVNVVRRVAVQIDSVSLAKFELRGAKIPVYGLNRYAQHWSFLSTQNPNRRVALAHSAYTPSGVHHERIHIRDLHSRWGTRAWMAL